MTEINLFNQTECSCNIPTLYSVSSWAYENFQTDLHFRLLRHFHFVSRSYIYVKMCNFEFTLWLCCFCSYSFYSNEKAPHRHFDNFYLNIELSTYQNVFAFRIRHINRAEQVILNKHNVKWSHHR